MQRDYPPFNTNRFILNKETGEIHDLNNEKPQCNIDSMNPHNVLGFDRFDHAQIHAVLVEHLPNPNGCHYCFPSKDNG